MKRILFALLFVAVSLQAQSVAPYNDIALGNANGIAVVLSNANVRVCTVPTSTNPPCTTLATNLKKLNPDSTCGTTVQPNPFSSDPSGNYSFCAPAGYYVVETSKQRFGTVRVPIVVSAIGGGTGGVCGPGQVVTGINPDGTPICGSAGGVVSAPHNILSTTHTDTTPAAVQQGDMVVGVGSPTTWQRVAKGNASYCWMMDPTGTFPQWASCPSAISSNPKVVPPPPFNIPSGQAVAWAFPDTCTAHISFPVGGTVLPVSDPAYAFQCGTIGGTATRFASGLTTAQTYDLTWTGFTMPSVPLDAVIQNIYPVFIGSRSGVLVGFNTISCNGVTVKDFSTSPGGGYFSENTSLGSTVGTVTGSSCTNASNSTTSSSGADVQSTQLIALAIYYTTANAPQQDSSTFFAFPYYAAINGVTPTFTTLADGSPIAGNMQNQFIENKTVALNHLTATRALNMSNMQSGGVYLFRFTQDGTGGAALTGGSGCTWQVNNAQTTTIPISTSANAVQYMSVAYDGTNCLVDFPLTGGGGGGVADPGGNGIMKRTALNVTAPAVAADVNTALGYTAADDSTVVHKTGNETIAGTKTFSSDIVAPGLDVGGLGFNGWQGEFLNLNGGTAPTITSGCGTSPSITGFDNAFTITGGTGTYSTCTVTFSRTWDHVPACTVNNRGVLAATRATPTTTTVVIDSASNFAAGGKIDAICY